VIDARISVRGAVLAGTLTRRSEAGPLPGVLLLGGTFSDLRDGDADPRHRPDIPPHGMYRLLAESLTTAGFAVLRFDRRGCGESSGSRPDRATEVEDGLAAWRWLAEETGTSSSIAIVGESAGAYVLCRMAAAGATPAAAVLQGALYRSIAGLIRFNAERARVWWERGPAERAWLWLTARREYESAALWPALAAALEAGDRSVAVNDERGRIEHDLTDLAFDIANPPAEQFRHLRCPTLVVHGADDLNVPVEDSLETIRALWDAGNRDVELRILARADHSMQQTPDDVDERLRERLSMASFRRPFHALYPSVLTDFLVRCLLPGGGPAAPVPVGERVGGLPGSPGSLA
jgi:hypothetical protein